ncbi:BppU family phage baseplate upper protein [Clostridium saccharoperbutylacetonicum]|uniref:BppU family phage baseplate upper protein n=1 Tax=Clostridium saccharoperbutylacetonicum TaxID=36745 RepID=UPI0039ECFB93
MSRTINLTIDVNSRKVTKFQDLVKLGDTLSLSITALDGSKNYDFTNKSVHIFLKKADNTKVEQTLTIAGNVVSVDTLDSQASTKVGQVEGELVILDASNNAQITSSTFTWEVEGSVNGEVLEESKDSIQTLINIENIISNYNENKDALAAENTKATNNISSLTTQNQQATNNIAALQAMGDLTNLQADITAAKTEIQNARGTYANLKARFDANDAQLSEKVNYNYIINGDFQVWQRGTSFTPTSGTTTYVADRWAMASISPVTYSQTNTGLRITNTTDFTFNSRFQQSIEVPKSLQGKTVTLSFKVKCSVNKNIGVAIVPYNEAVIASKAVAITSTSQVYSITLTLPTGKDIISVIFGLSTNTTSYNGLTAVTNFPVCNIDFEWVKLEYGSIATPFVPRLYSEELALCQRYYETIQYSVVQPTTATGQVVRAIYNFKTIKRTTPTVVLNDGYRGGFGLPTLLSYANGAVGVQATSTSVFNGSEFSGSINADSEIY